MMMLATSGPRLAVLELHRPTWSLRGHVWVCRECSRRVGRPHAWLCPALRDLLAGLDVCRDHPDGLVCILPDGHQGDHLEERERWHRGVTSAPVVAWRAELVRIHAPAGQCG